MTDKQLEAEATDAYAEGCKKWGVIFQQPSHSEIKPIKGGRRITLHNRSGKLACFEEIGGKLIDGNMWLAMR